MTLIKSISGIRGTIGGVCGDALTPLDIVKFTAAYAAFIKSKEFRENCITVTDDAATFVKAGKSVFAKHVIKCGNNIHPGSEVIVINTMNKVIAIGKAILSKKMIKDFKSGVALKIRNGVN